MVIKGKVPRWYRWSNGIVEPMYELQKKDKSGMKAYTLREARELKLLPSVTSVLSVIDKPELDNWRVSQAIHSALTLPRYPDEGEDAFAERVLADAEAQANKAAEFGTRIHDAIAQLMNSKYHAHRFGAGLAITYEKDLDPYIEGFIEWANGNIEEVHAVEKCVGHPSIGVAGRMDLDCTIKGVGRCIADFKTQAVRNGKATFYDEWPMQLAAYAACCGDEYGADRSILSVVIDSAEPGPIHSKAWPVWGSYFSAFEHALELWIYTRGNGYDPRS